MNERIFVTGNGTGVGKTIAAAILAEALHAHYWKPIQAGDLHRSDTMTVTSLVSWQGFTAFPEGVRLKTAASPHAAAGIEQLNLSCADLRAPEAERLIIEGAGGVLVPLSMDELIVDLIEHLGAGVVVVSRHYLGSINHTLLTLETLMTRNIPVLGVLFNGPSNPDTEEAILRFSGVKPIGNIEQEGQLTPEIVAGYAGKLAPRLRELCCA